MATEMDSDVSDGPVLVARARPATRNPSPAAVDAESDVPSEEGFRRKRPRVQKKKTSSAQPRAAAKATEAPKRRARPTATQDTAASDPPDNPEGNIEEGPVVDHELQALVDAHFTIQDQQGSGSFHVYRDSEGLVYSARLRKGGSTGDAAERKYCKLQLLESDGLRRGSLQYMLFIKWGRASTSTPGKLVQDVGQDAFAAQKAFDVAFAQRTGGLVFEDSGAAGGPARRLPGAAGGAGEDPYELCPDDDPLEAGCGKSSYRVHEQPAPQQVEPPARAAPAASQDSMGDADERRLGGRGKRPKKALPKRAGAVAAPAPARLVHRHKALAADRDVEEEEEEEAEGQSSGGDGSGDRGAKKASAPRGAEARKARQQQAGPDRGRVRPDGGRRRLVAGSSSGSEDAPHVKAVRPAPSPSELRAAALAGLSLQLPQAAAASAAAAPSAPPRLASGSVGAVLEALCAPPSFEAGLASLGLDAAALLGTLGTPRLEARLAELARELAGALKHALLGEDADAMREEAGDAELRRGRDRVLKLLTSHLPTAAAAASAAAESVLVPAVAAPELERLEKGAALVRSAAALSSSAQLLRSLAALRRGGGIAVSQVHPLDHLLASLPMALTPASPSEEAAVRAAFNGTLQDGGGEGSDAALEIRHLCRVVPYDDGCSAAPPSEEGDGPASLMWWCGGPSAAALAALTSLASADPSSKDPVDVPLRFTPCAERALEAASPGCCKAARGLHPPPQHDLLLLLCEVDAGRAAPDLTPTSASESEALLGRGPQQPFASQRVRGALVPAAAHLAPTLAPTSPATGRSGAGAPLSLPATRTQPGAPAELFSVPPPDSAADAALAAPRVFGGGLVPAALPSPAPFDELVLAGAGQARVRFIAHVQMRLP